MDKKKITIKRSPSADSRTSPIPIPEKTLRSGTNMHIGDVRKAIGLFQSMLGEAGLDHDNTKISKMKDFTDALNGGDIKRTDWYKYHITEERHHLKSHVPDDVTLIDVLEYVADIVTAGMARSGEVYDDDLSPTVLKIALANTIELLKKSIIVKE